MSSLVLALLFWLVVNAGRSQFLRGGLREELKELKKLVQCAWRTDVRGKLCQR